MLWKVAHTLSRQEISFLKRWEHNSVIQLDTYNNNVSNKRIPSPIWSNARLLTGSQPLAGTWIIPTIDRKDQYKAACSKIHFSQRTQPSSNWANMFPLKGQEHWAEGKLPLVSCIITLEGSASSDTQPLLKVHPQGNFLQNFLHKAG